ncbi:MAG: hypothetical protein J3K34DRAFT_520977 [Monoraphidium minutum]|nr:MAG: hypothetical protein J3K34DRAFT_520977 [Monoraphidium minutum]
MDTAQWDLFMGGGGAEGAGRCLGLAPLLAGAAAPGPWGAPAPPACGSPNSSAASCASRASAAGWSPGGAAPRAALDFQSDFFSGAAADPVLALGRGAPASDSGLASLSAAHSDAGGAFMAGGQDTMFGVGSFALPYAPRRPPGWAALDAARAEAGAAERQRAALGAALQEQAAARQHLRERAAALDAQQAALAQQEHALMLRQAALRDQGGAAPHAWALAPQAPPGQCIGYVLQDSCSYGYQPLPQAACPIMVSEVYALQPPPPPHAARFAAPPTDAAPPPAGGGGTGVFIPRVSATRLARRGGGAARQAAAAALAH